MEKEMKRFMVIGAALAASIGLWGQANLPVKGRIATSGEAIGPMQPPDDHAPVIFSDGSIKVEAQYRPPNEAYKFQVGSNYLNGDYQVVVWVPTAVDVPSNGKIKSQIGQAKMVATPIKLAEGDVTQVKIAVQKRTGATWAPTSDIVLNKGANGLWVIATGNLAGLAAPANAGKKFEIKRNTPEEIRIDSVTTQVGTQTSTLDVGTGCTAVALLQVGTNSLAATAQAPCAGRMIQPGAAPSKSINGVNAVVLSDRFISMSTGGDARLNDKLLKQGK
jgi:hypothetical protein